MAAAAGGGCSGEQRAALLGDAAEQESWSHALDVEPPPAEGPSVQELVRESPERVIQALQREGMQRVASFCLPDKLVLGRLGDDSIATMGADRAQLDFEAAWRRELGPCCAAADQGRHSRQQGLSDSSSGGDVRAGGGGLLKSWRGQREQEWCAEIPVVALVVSVRDAAAPAAAGLLRPLLRRWQAGGCAAATFRLPVVQAVVDWKWRFVRRVLVWELALFLLWTASFYGFALAYRVQDAPLSLPQLLRTGRGRLTMACELLGLAAMLPFLWIELCTFAAYGLAWLADAWRLLGLATYVLQAVVVAFHLGRLPASEQVIPVAAAVQCVLLLFRLQFFSRVFPATRYAFLEDISQVMHDLKWFILFLALVMAAFAAAFLVLFGPDAAAGRQKREFAGLGRSMITMLSWVAGDPNLTLLYSDVAHPVAACLMGTAYIFSFALILSTLFIALMNVTLQRVTQEEPVRMLLSKAGIIDELESTASGLLRRLFPRMHARFIHVLRVDPDKLDAVKLDRLWKSMSDAEADKVGGRATGGGGAAAGAPSPAPPAQPAIPQPAGRPPHPPAAFRRLASGGSATSEPRRTAPGGAQTASDAQQARQPQHAQHHRLASLGDRLGSLEPPSAGESVPGEAPPSVRWRGSLLEAYLGGGGGGPLEEADPLAYQRLLLGEGGMDAQSEGGALPASSAEMAALREEVHELKRLLLAALERLPSNTALSGGGGSAAAGGGAAAVGSHSS